MIFAKPAADQDELFERFQLNSSMVREQAFQGRIYRLHDDEPPMLRMTRDFCQAIGPPEVAEKLSRLRSLLQSDASDEGLKASVLKAIAAIEERLRSKPSGG